MVTSEASTMVAGHHWVDLINSIQLGGHNEIIILDKVTLCVAYGG
jgi:hypothetical protein